MPEVLGEALPLALAIAASPFTIIPAILLLFTARPLPTSSAFLAGWIAGIATSSAVFAMLASVIDRMDDQPTWASWLRILLGALLVILGVRQWLGRRADKPAPAWMQSLEAATPRRAARLAVILALANPKILLLSAAAGLAIGSADLSAGATALAVIVFTLVAALSVAIPVGLYVVRGDRVLGPLGTARRWLERNNAAVMAIVFVVIGLALMAKGIASLR